METSQYSAPVSRALTVAVGVVVTIIGTSLLAFFGFGIYRFRSGLQPLAAMIFLFFVGALGLALCVVGLRLSSGKQRRDGGLFSPWMLRLGGIIFLFGPVAAVLNRSWLGLLEAGVSLSAAIACFVLANRRQEAAADPRHLTVVGGDSDAQ